MKTLSDYVCAIPQSHIMSACYANICTATAKVRILGTGNGDRWFHLWDTFTNSVRFPESIYTPLFQIMIEATESYD